MQFQKDRDRETYENQIGEFKEHTPDYLSVNQVPVIYNPTLKPKLFGEYLCQVLYRAEIRTAVELLGYTFYRANPFENYRDTLWVWS